MANDKSFLTYNQQMKKLRNDKNIDCNGTPHKISLVRSGYFNMIKGYKTPFTCGTDANGNHIYFPNTTLSQINSLKKFDETLRIFLLKYITQVEEEVRTFTSLTNVMTMEKYHGTRQMPILPVLLYNQK